MKTNIIILLILQFLLPAYILAQVTVGSGDPPHESAILDLQSSNKGFLGPRVALTGKYDNTTIPNAAPGLLIINTAPPDMNQPEDERVYPYKFYYWVESGTPRWESLIGHDELDYWVEQEIIEWAMPQPVLFHLNGKDKLADNRLGILNFMSGVSANSSKELLLTDSVNHSGGSVQLKAGTQSTIILEPGIYNIIFAYLFIPTPASTTSCNHSSYFMEFPFYPRDESGFKYVRVYSDTYHHIQEKSSHAATINFVSPIQQRTEWTVKLGAGTSTCTSRSGFSLPNRNTFLYITRVGDW